MAAISDISAVSPQIQAAATGKAYSAQKQEGQAAAQLIESATQATEASISSGPKATGNNIDVTV
ncbi:MAG: hypothetical protein NPINA01_21890 [Nitrospinaceae bacterium]|nr:MAG: hypothetical protein NPINA01_21890 [Nitrospinaceae bacterium]